MSMDSLAARKQRLALVVKNARDDRGIENQRALADLTGVSLRTIAGIETGDRTPGQNTLNRLDVAFGVPIGSLQAVLDGAAKDIPAPGDGVETATDSDEPEYEVGGNVYTMAELRGIAKALGPNGLYEWAMKAATSDDASAPGAV